MSTHSRRIAGQVHVVQSVKAAFAMRRASAGSDADPASVYEFVMMTFVNMDSPGLLILPTHRVVHGFPSFSMDTFRVNAAEFFTVDEVDPSLDAKRATAILKEAACTGTSLLAVARDRVFLLSRPKSPDFAFAGVSLRQQGLDVVQLHKCLLEGVLNISGRPWQWRVREKPTLPSS